MLKCHKICKKSPPKIRNYLKCHNKLDCLIFWKCFFFYQRAETNAKQTVQFNLRQIVCVEQFL